MSASSAVVKLTGLNGSRSSAAGQEHHASAGRQPVRLQPVQHRPSAARPADTASYRAAAAVRLRRMPASGSLSSSSRSSAKQAVDEVVRLRLQATVAQDALIEAAVHHLPSAAAMPCTTSSALRTPSSKAVVPVGPAVPAPLLAVTSRRSWADQLCGLNSGCSDEALPDIAIVHRRVRVQGDAEQGRPQAALGEYSCCR